MTVHPALALLNPGRCRVIGILNVTPDSFSDGGRYLDREDAVAHGVALRAEGADLIDVGGESTRPRAHRVEAPTEIARVVPVIRELAECAVPCSVDTTRAAVAEAALEAGAIMVNDVSGGLADPAMAPTVARCRVPWILVHWRGPSAVMHTLASYSDVVAEVRAELVARVDAAVLAGVEPGALVLDPGIGFAKTAAHNWTLLGHLDALTQLGFPVLLGASRKRFLGALLTGGQPPECRDTATAVVSALAATAGVWGVRVHNAAASREAIAVAAAWQAGACRTVGPAGGPR